VVQSPISGAEAGLEVKMKLEFLAAVVLYYSITTTLKEVSCQSMGILLHLPQTSHAQLS